ncbi:uncharacterized protein LOC114626830 [Grammomys surdaster]|uniref:uncharacterized protein LOC114626830 n=1 Tax=Grammomys surdaster TaxID=491861 RepID=UPI0010A005F8|nr:uncharacterized protein LOC114626830 [Grammomys surdaster]
MEISNDITNSEELWKMKPQGNLEDDSYSEKPRIFCDVTSVVVIPTACGVFFHSLLGSQAVMLSMLLSVFQRDNRIQAETRSTQKKLCKAGRRRWPWGRRRSVGKESSKAYTISEQEQRMKRLEKLKRDLEMMNKERHELQGILAHYTNKDLNDRINFEDMMLEMEHDQVMTNLKKIPQEISEALYKCKELTQENQLYCIRNFHLLTESLHMKNQVKILWNENRQLLREQIALEECSKETKRLCVEASMKIYDKYTKQQQKGLLRRSQGLHLV